jgi:hypothetical protein
MTERIACNTPGCKGMILPDTAARTGGLCMPCVGAIAKRERDEFVRLNRREVNEFEGITDVVEVLKIIHRPFRFDPLLRPIAYPVPVDQLYPGLTASETKRLAAYAEELIGTDRNNEAEDICRCLAAFTDAPVDDCLRKFVRHFLYRPSLAFRRAPDDVRDELLARVEFDSERRNNILVALAWIGDEAVVRRFDQWRRIPPSWRKTLYVPPQNYAHEAGWELTEDGQRRNLYFEKCARLAKRMAEPMGTFRAIREREDICPWCASHLTTLFELPSDLIDTTPGWPEKISVATCEICTVFGVIYGLVDHDGAAHWSGRNERPKYLPDDADSWHRLPKDSLDVAALQTATFAADQFLPTTFSCLGGLPAWVQDAEYPHCPECSKSMTFLAQIDRQDLEEYGEGIYYAFICSVCRTTATSYQQS